MAPPFFRFPRPRSFLHLVPLRTATEFIAFTFAINKVTGLYGLLALLTGYHLNPLQLSHYIYSLLVLALGLYLTPAIRQRDADGALKVLVLAWVYVLDTVINTAYTALFGLGWFVVLSQHLDQDAAGTGGSMTIPGGKTMNHTAGFTDPEHTVSQVDIVATPAPGSLTGQQATAYGSFGSSSTLGGAILGRDGISSVTVLGLLWLTRIYCCIIVLSFARKTLRQHIASISASSTSYTPSTPSDNPNLAPNPFHSSSSIPSWRGRLGSLMLRFPSQRYWLGRDEREEEWARQTSSRLESARGLRIKVPVEAAGGLGERERRARSGTGPPLPVLGAKGKVVE
ncbi:hypothetical protein B0A55_03456 [Friedmanniomyces simplex]|uniref:DUF1753 domain-containing protein n=1 Tax=Friedmanniomyces simplex TaxID=329884 RepID=A0A4U0XPI1_9PEZI|nr:hypothetical protein B0A55_03456 [Friedmanniomyces simplex]